MEAARWQSTWLDGPIAVMALDRKGASITPDFETFLVAAEEGLRREGRFGVVVDLEGSQADAMRRKKLARWAETHADEITQKVVAIAVVARGPVERGVLTAMTWVMRPKMPVEAFLTKLEATAWAREKLRQPKLAQPRGTSS